MVLEWAYPTWVVNVAATQLESQASYRFLTTVMTRKRLQLYLEPDLAELIRQRAEDGHRPESWEVERLIRLGLQATQAEEDQKA